ncbi:MAG: tRNA lysidine(34) synthetase TilS [Nitrospira sp.]|nr:tRNA lysidine(34) synthetase TilS [Nitrospira sp.]
MKKLRRQEDLKLAHKVEQHLREWGVSRGDLILAGVSGGPDSVCLLHLLKTVSESFPIRLHVAHLDHGLRGKESMADARFVQNLCHEWKIPVAVESGAVSVLAKQRRLSLQVAAREARYTFFERIADKIQCRWIALGHTADDQAETFLLRLLRGAGSKGLSSIPLQREIQATSDTKLRIIRPLLNVERKQVLDYLKARSIPYRLDPSNLKPFYLRNRLRQEVIPLLKSHYNPKLIETLYRTAELLGEEQDFLQAQASQMLSQIQVKASGPGMVLDRNGFIKFHRALQRVILRKSIERIKGNLVGVTYRHLEDALCLIREGKAGSHLKMPGGVSVRLVYDRCWIYLDRGDFITRMEEIALSIPGEVHSPSLGFVAKTRLEENHVSSDERVCAAFDYEKIHPPFTIRGRRPGDYFFPCGMGGKRKKLQDFFVDHKVPRHERDRIPLLTASEGILWVVGWRLDGRFIASPDSRKIMVVEFKIN